jgi:hypothetical protein
MRLTKSASEIVLPMAGSCSRNRWVAAIAWRIAGVLIASSSAASTRRYNVLVPPRRAFSARSSCWKARLSKK